MRDLKEFYQNNMENIQIVAEDDNISVVHALIHGPESTPYAKGFFYFMVKFPTNYPISPPTVKLMTTDRQRVRFNPNLYKCGKVCLSILGTWSGPAWSPCHTLLTVLLSIQSLMNEKPFHNEPGYEATKVANSSDYVKKAETYNEIITHETIRVAIIGMLDENSCDARNMPQVLKDFMICSFKKNYKYFEDLVKSKLDLTNKPMKDPFSDSRGDFQYKTLLDKLIELKNKFNINVDNEVETSGAANEPTISKYSEIASKYIVVEVNQPINSDPTDNWDAIIEDMAMEDNDDEVNIEEYSEESDSCDEQIGAKQTDQ
jgi:ubiquitin-conjugating enzyme E2 Z